MIFLRIAQLRGTGNGGCMALDLVFAMPDYGRW